MLDRVAFQIEKETIKRRVKGAMISDDGHDLRDPRPDRDADVPRPGVREHLRAARRRPADADRLGRQVSDFLRGNFYIVFPALFAVGFGIRKFKRTEQGRRLWDRIKLKIPMKIGQVVLKVTLARFSRTLSTLIAAGVDIIKALEITGQTSGNWVVEEALADVRARVHEGVPIATPLSENAVFPPMVSHMVKIGEETGGSRRCFRRSRTSTRTRSTPRSSR